jgi:uncharacterized protein YggE
MARSHHVLPIVAAAALALPSAAAAQTEEHTLSVVGSGDVELTPDRGSISVTVTRRSNSANVARSRTSRRIAAIVRGMRSAGVPLKGIQTEAVSVAKVRRRASKDAPVRVVYRARASLDVSVDGLKLLGRAITIASKRGASQVYGPSLSFTPALRDSGLQRAEDAALKDARARADAAADTTGQRIVGIQSIDLDPDEDLLNYAADSGGSALSRAPTEILAGRETFTSTARVTYLIEPV